MNKEFAAKILNCLTKERFHQWYENDFENYIVVEYPAGHPKHKSESQILEDITKLFDSIAQISLTIHP